MSAYVKTVCDMCEWVLFCLLLVCCQQHDLCWLLTWLLTTNLILKKGFPGGDERTWMKHAAKWQELCILPCTIWQNKTHASRFLWWLICKHKDFPRPLHQLPSSRNSGMCTTCTCTFTTLTLNMKDNISHVHSSEESRRHRFKKIIFEQKWSL